MPVIKKLVCVLLVWGLVVVALLLDVKVSTVARLELAMNLHRIDCDCETSNLSKDRCELYPQAAAPLPQPAAAGHAQPGQQGVQARGVRLLQISRPCVTRTRTRAHNDFVKVFKIFCPNFRGLTLFKMLLVYNQCFERLFLLRRL